MIRCVVDAGPFIHLGQVGEIGLLKKFPVLYTPASVVSEISVGRQVPIQEIRNWKNLQIVRVEEKGIPQIKRIIKNFKLHTGERQVIYLAQKLKPCIVLTDDLAARDACERLRIETHGSVGIIAYAFHHKWISFSKAKETLLMLSRKSALFITSAIIERAIIELRKAV